MVKEQNFVEAEDLYRIKMPLSPRLNPRADRAVYILKWADEQERCYQTRLHLIDIKRKTDIEYTRGLADSDPVWHPSGKKILYLNHEAKNNMLRSISVFGGESRDILALGKGSVSRLQWSPDGKYISFLMQESDEAEPLPGEGVETESSAGEGEKGRNGRSQAALVGSGEPVVRTVETLHYRTDGEGWRPKAERALYILKAGAKEAVKITPEGGHDVNAYAWSPDSQMLAYCGNGAEDPDRDPDDERIWIYSLDEGVTVELPKKKGLVEQVFFGATAGELYFIGQFDLQSLWGASNMQLYRLDMDSGRAENLSESLDRTLDNVSLGDISPSFTAQVPAFDEEGNLYFTVSSEGGNPLMQLRPDGSMEAVLEGPEVIVSYHKAAENNQFILHMAQMDRPDELWSLELGESKSLTKLTRLNDAYLESRRFNIPEVHTVPGEGAMVQTWILRPPAFKEGDRCPMILNIHGGPRAQYAYTWFHEMQVLAARGFIVVYSNPQGSQGYGEEFAHAIDRSWAEPAYSDLMAVTDYMLESGSVDPEKIFVTGGSYGGYMTNWIVSHTDRFRAAVTQRCVSNLASFFGSSDFGWLLEHEFGGTPWEKREIYDTWSPISYAGQIKTPLLIIHSEEDLRCPMEQAEQLFVRLKYEGVAVKFLRYPEESHGLSRGGRPDRRIHRLKSIYGWFEQYL